MKNLLRFATLISAIITLSALMAHVLELPQKITLSKENYLTVQSIYSGWAWLGITEIGALILSIIWLISIHVKKKLFNLLLIACIYFLLGLVIFFIYTYPANVQTNNWTQLPANWELLRKQWEYSHAVHAVLNFIGICLLIIVLLKERIALPHYNQSKNG